MRKDFFGGQDEKTGICIMDTATARVMMHSGCPDCKRNVEFAEMICGDVLFNYRTREVIGIALKEVE